MLTRKKLEECIGKKLTAFEMHFDVLVAVFEDCYTAITVDYGYDPGEAEFMDDAHINIIKCIGIPKLVTLGIVSPSEVPDIEQQQKLEEQRKEEERKQFRRQQYELLKSEFEPQHIENSKKD